MEFVQHLMEKVGLSEEQAKGGAGLLLQQAKEKLSGDQFDKVKEAIPNANELADEAPEPDSGGGLGGMLGGIASKFGGIGSLAGGLTSLGLDASQIAQFGPSAINWVKEHAPESVQGILTKVMGSEE